MNRHVLVVQDPTDCMSGRLPEERTTQRQPVQEFRQDLIGRDQAHLSKRLPGVNCLAAVLIVRVKYCAPIKRIREDQLHFFFGALWR